MINLAEYAIKSGIALTVTYLVYFVFLRKDTHFRMNRIILVFSVLLSMVLPAVAPYIIRTPAALESIPVVSIDLDLSSTALSPENNVAAAVFNPVSSAAENSRRDIWKIIGIIYLAGACIVFARLIYQAIFLHAVSRLSQKTSHDGFTIISMTAEMVPFSYFNKIYIPAAKIDEGSFDSIVAHEKSHLRQWHYLDLFLIEIISIIHWFNPVIWFYEKSIKEVHEYLADEAVLDTGKNAGKYQALLVNQAMGGPVFILTNQFNQSLIKKRIMMMKKMKTSRVAKLKALLMLPLMAGLLLAFAGPQINDRSVSDGEKITVTGNVTDRSTGKSISGSVVLIKGTTIGTVSTADGNYKIVVGNAGDVLVFSQVGYRSQEIPVGNNTKINVELEQDFLALDFSQGNKLVLDENRAKERQKEKPAGEKENLYVITEELPAYPGGTDALLKFLQANLQYPAVARNKGIQGRVLMTYIIDINGEVTHIKIIRGLSPEIDKEALRVTSMIKGWKPAMQNGKPIPLTVTMPVEFKIN